MKNNLIMSDSNSKTSSFIFWAISILQITFPQIPKKLDSNAVVNSGVECWVFNEVVKFCTHLHNKTRNANVTSIQSPTFVAMNVWLVTSHKITFHVVKTTEYSYKIYDAIKTSISHLKTHPSIPKKKNHKDTKLNLWAIIVAQHQQTIINRQKNNVAPYFYDWDADFSSIEASVQRRESRETHPFCYGWMKVQ